MSLDDALARLFALHGSISSGLYGRINSTILQMMQARRLTLPHPHLVESSLKINYEQGRAVVRNLSDESERRLPFASIEGISVFGKGSPMRRRYSKPN